MIDRIRAVLFALAMVAMPVAAWGSPFQGQLWIVSNSGLQATFPVPTATPDMTFITSHLSFFMNAPSPAMPTAPTFHATIKGFLTSANGVSSAKFSGLVNDVLGGIVGLSTPAVNSTATSNGTYGVFLEFTGAVQLQQDEWVTIVHDDGVSLMIDGQLVSGLTSGPTSVVAELFQFTGTTGSHNIDLVYANNVGLGYLSFGPQM